MELKYFLKNLPAFEEFRDDYLDLFASSLQVEAYPDGHILIAQGQQGKALYLLLSGAVNISRHNMVTGVVDVIRELNDGEMFGIISLVDDLPATASCVARGQVKVASLSRESFAQLFDSAIPVVRHLQYMIAVQLARDLQEESRRIRSQGQQD